VEINREDTTNIDVRFAPADALSQWAVRIRPRGVVGYLLGVAGFTGAYYVAAQAGYELQFTGSISAIWPPVGLAVAVLYLGGLRWWPGVVAGDLLSAESLSPLHTAIALAAANLAEAMVATILLRRLIGPRAKLDRVEQIGWMLVAIAPATAISAVVGSLMLVIDGVIDGGQVGSVLRTIWIGDSAGALVVLPFIIVWAPLVIAAARRPPPNLPVARILEALAMVAAVLGLSAIVLASPRPIAYLVFPALIWAAVRFGQRGATLAVFCAAGMAVWRTANNVGPFIEHSITQTTLTTQLYIGVAALTTLCLGAIVSERQRSAADLVESRRRELERASDERQRIARDLHDSVSQSLFSMTLHARAAERALRQTGRRATETVGRELGRVRELSSTALAEMRALIFELRPGGLAEEGLVSALTKHAAAVSAREGLPIDVSGPSERLPISHDDEEHLYRLGQEALANLVKHAQAGQGAITVTNDGSAVGLEVRDDGRGFDSSAAYTGHLGLQTMRSRAGEIGAELAIDSAPGRGTLVSVRLPVAEMDGGA
jgi:signal transduction histidine kinase